MTSSTNRIATDDQNGVAGTKYFGQSNRDVLNHSSKLPSADLPYA
jgi:hypothetical protein